MSTKIKPIAIIGSTNETAWHAERAKGVTKSDIRRLASGTLAAKRAVYADKQGETPVFRGNAATRRGHEYEASIATWVEKNLGIPPSQVLYGHGENFTHRATPDCFFWEDGEGSLVEIKTTVEDWSGGLPREILIDVLWQRYVLGAGYTAVAWQQFSRDGQPLTLEPTLTEVTADPEMEAWLIGLAEEYQAWVDAGCPDEDSDLPTEIRDALEELGKAKEAVKRYEEIVKGYAAPILEKTGKPVKATVRGIQLSFTGSSRSTLDVEAWRKAAPEACAAWEEAKKTYSTKSYSTRLTVTPIKEKKNER